MKKSENNVPESDWHNYGDINFMEHGGCLIREDSYKDCFQAIVLITQIPGYEEKYNDPVIVARCFVDISCFMDEDTLREVNLFSGNEREFIPTTLEEKESYFVDLINYYGIQEFDPDFPEETGCGCYALGTMDRWIVEREIAQTFMEEYGVPLEFRE